MKVEEPPSWVLSGDVGSINIQEVLNGYRLNVGLLIYSHHNDTLQTILIDKLGNSFRSSCSIKEEVLTAEIDNANKFFSNNFFSSVPLDRGAKIQSISESSDTLKKGV